MVKISNQIKIFLLSSSFLGNFIFSHDPYIKFSSDFYHQSYHTDRCNQRCDNSLKESGASQDFSCNKYSDSSARSTSKKSKLTAQHNNHLVQDNNMLSRVIDRQDHTESMKHDPAFAMFQAQMPEYNALCTVYSAHLPSLYAAIEKRSNAFNVMIYGDHAIQYIAESYDLKSSVKQSLSQYRYSVEPLTYCYGNSLNHAIHQESLEILSCINNLPSSSVLYDHHEALIELTMAMVDYNHIGFTDKAMNIGDLCWTLLDYGQAIAEGIVLGVYSAAHDILTNPIEATVSIVAGKQVLAFQLCKVLYNVAEIGIVAIHDSQRAQEEWNKYIEPLNNLIDAINKKEVTVRNAIKGGTAFVIGYKAQGKLLGGLGKFCNAIKHKSISFVKNNGLLHLQEYLITPEGLLFKATGQSGRIDRSTASNIKNNVENKIAQHIGIKGLLKKARLPTKGKLRYVPPKKLHVAQGLPQVVWHDRRRGFVDRFGNVWLKGESRTQGHDFEWDVQLSKQGIHQVGWMTRDNSHLNVSLDGRVTHK